MVEPLTLSVLGAAALTEGIKFLYGQAGDVLKRWRERKNTGEGPRADEPEPLQVDTPDVLVGELQPVSIHFQAVERLADDLRVFSARLGNYANGLDEVDPKDEELLEATDALRRVLEAVYQQRITFEGETTRPPSGPVVAGRIDVDEVAGYAAALRADIIESGKVTLEARAKRVEPGGELIGGDVKRIGGRSTD